MLNIGDLRGQQPTAQQQVSSCQYQSSAQWVSRKGDVKSQTGYLDYARKKTSGSTKSDITQIIMTTREKRRITSSIAIAIFKVLVKYVWCHRGWTLDWIATSFHKNATQGCVELSKHVYVYITIFSSIWTFCICSQPICGEHTQNE